MEQEAEGSLTLFAIFLLSLYSVFLIPYTLSLLFGGDGDEKEIVKTWSSKRSAPKESTISKVTTRLREVFTMKVIIMWTVWFLLIWFIRAAGKPTAGFDPFTILQVDEDATEQEIKKAYRKLSLQFHPDKNPDPETADYFANYITKAYKALTDEVSRENYKKYGHPDGPQAMSVSVALPEWFFSKDKEMAPVILLSLLFGGIVLPLGLASCYLSKSNKYTGPNEVMLESVQRYCHPRFGIKQSQGVGKLLDTLVWAQEFQDIIMTPDQRLPLDDVRRAVIANHSDIRDKNNVFWKRHPAFVKAHMLLLAHMDRDEIPIELKKDLNTILAKTPSLLQELFSISVHPRIRPAYGWLAPSVACVEMMQCLVQAVPADEKKKSAIGKTSTENATALLQLPHFTPTLVKTLARKKVKTLADIESMDVVDRKILLQSNGLTGAQCEDIETMLSALPTVWISADMVIDGPEGIDNSSAAPTELVTCRCQVMLTRPSHMAPGFDPDTIKGKAAQAYAPRFPVPREENWFFLVGDVTNNTLVGWSRLPLLQAEAIGARYAANWVSKNTTSAVSKIHAASSLQNNKSGGGVLATTPLLTGTKFDPFTAAVDGNNGTNAADSLDASLEELGQTVEIKFYAPEQFGKHDLTLFVMPDSWLGADKILPLKLRVSEQRAQELVSMLDSNGRLKKKPFSSSKKNKQQQQASKQQQQQGAQKRSGGGDATTTTANDNLHRSEESEMMMEGEYDEDDAEIESDAGDGGYSDEEGEEYDEDSDGEAEEQEYDSEEYGTEESEDEH